MFHSVIFFCLCSYFVRDPSSSDATCLHSLSEADCVMRIFIYAYGILYVTFLILFPHKVNYVFARNYRNRIRKSAEDIDPVTKTY
jgi:hypothetical protein